MLTTIKTKTLAQNNIPDFQPGLVADGDICYFRDKLYKMVAIPPEYFDPSTDSGWVNTQAEARFRRYINKITWRSRVWFFFYNIKHRVIAWLRRTRADIAVFLGIC